MEGIIKNISPKKLVYLGILLGSLSLILKRFFDSPRLSPFFQGFFLSLAIVSLVNGFYKMSKLN